MTGQVKNLFEGFLQWGHAISNAEVKKEANRREMDQCRWVKPNLVAKWRLSNTDAGHLRHYTFVARRDDKKPAKVVRDFLPRARLRRESVCRPYYAEPPLDKIVHRAMLLKQ